MISRSDKERSAIFASSIAAPAPPATLHGLTIVGWLDGDTFIAATPADDASAFLNLGYRPLIEVPPSTAFALPTKD